ncbi:unnamed protein product [Citrullus colocynthis]|uniref:Uncharacterized protein n=1 Tax=Citrullus colocynthis TaxID=252529 RepID=A0ABP0YE14_9ROSI
MGSCEAAVVAMSMAKSSESQFPDLRKQLRAFESDSSEIITLCEAEYVEKILEETLRKVLVHKQLFLLQKQCNSSATSAELLRRKNRRGSVIQQVNQPLQLPLLSPVRSEHLRATFSPNLFPLAIRSLIEAVPSSFDENQEASAFSGEL